MEIAVRVAKVGGGRYRARVELGGVTVYGMAGSYGSRGEARDAAVRTLTEGLGAVMRAFDPQAEDEHEHEDDDGDPEAEDGDDGW